jgi:hypothetical protein
MAELRAALRSTLESAAAGAMFPDLSCGDLSTRTAPGPAPGVSSHADGTESAGMGADAAARHCAKAVELACSWRHRGATQEEDIEHSTNALADEIVAVAAWCPTPSRMRTLIHSAGSGVPLAAESRRDRDLMLARISPRLDRALKAHPNHPDLAPWLLTASNSGSECRGQGVCIAREDPAAQKFQQSGAASSAGLPDADGNTVPLQGLGPLLLRCSDPMKSDDEALSELLRLVVNARPSR